MFSLYNICRLDISIFIIYITYIDISIYTPSIYVDIPIYTHGISNSAPEAGVWGWHITSW